MSNLIRWQPMRGAVTLRDAMDRLFDEAFTRPRPQIDGWRDVGGPFIDMYETETEVVIKASLPGLKPDEVQISVTGEMLTIKGETTEKAEVEDKAYHIREQRYGLFERTVPLPTMVTLDKAKAESDAGMVIITLPKAEEVKPKTITVKTK
jgi:HSP20 family protein